jgi:hypothetical protein
VLAGALLILTASLSFTGPATAQVGPPIRLGPPTLGSSDAGGTPPPPAQPVAPGTGSSAPAPAPALQSPSSEPRAPAIVVEQLERIPSDAAGAAAPARYTETGTPFPADPWAGTPGPIALRLIGMLPASPASAPQRGLQIRLLAESHRPPADLPVEGAFLEQRVIALRAMGALDALGRLSDSISRTAITPRMALALVDGAFALGRTEQACRLVRDHGGGARDARWLAAGLVCDAAAGDSGGVDFGVGLMAELGKPDPLLARLAQAYVSGAPGAAEDLSEAGPVHLQMAALSRTPVEPDLDLITDPAVLFGLSRGVVPLSDEDNLSAVEASEQLGLIATSELIAAYERLDAPASGIDGALKNRAAKARGMLWRLAQTETVPTARAATIKAAFGLIADPAGHLQTVRLFADTIAQLRPAADISDLAETALTALILAGRPDDAAPWVTWLAAEANRDPETRAIKRRIWPLLAVGFGGLSPAKTDTGADALWQGLGNDPIAARQAAMTLAVLEALGGAVDPLAWRTIVGLPTVEVLAAPSLAVQAGLNAAATEGRVAEAITLALAGLADTPLEDLDQGAVARTVRALMRVGFEVEARALAVQALTAHALTN